MNTFDDKLQAIFMEVLGVHISQSVHNKLKALFEAEMMDVIGEDAKPANFMGMAAAFGGTETIKEFEDSKILTQLRNDLRNEQRATLKEKLGREDTSKV